MTKRAMLAALICIPCLLVACGEDEGATNANAQQSSNPNTTQSKRGVTAGEVNMKASEVAGAAADYAQQQKAFIAKSQKELDQIEATLAEWRAKAKKASSDAKDAMKAKLDDLEKDRKAAEEKLSELKSSSANAWQDVKAGFLNAMDKLRDAYKKAKEDFA